MPKPSYRRLEALTEWDVLIRHIDKVAQDTIETATEQIKKNEIGAAAHSLGFAEALRTIKELPRQLMPEGEE